MFQRQAQNGGLRTAGMPTLLAWVRFSFWIPSTASAKLGRSWSVCYSWTFFSAPPSFYSHPPFLLRSGAGCRLSFFLHSANILSKLIKTTHGKELEVWFPSSQRFLHTMKRRESSALASEGFNYTPDCTCCRGTRGNWYNFPETLFFHQQNENDDNIYPTDLM